MFRSRKRLFLFVAAIFLFATGIVIFFLTPRHPSTATGAGGRKVTIEKITFGTHHRFVQGKWWLRLLKPIRGKSWAAQRGCYETRFTNDTPALMVWTRWDGINRSNTVALEAAIVDERGTESELVLNRWNAVSGAPSAHVAWLFKNFPRRSDSLSLRIYEQDKRYLHTQVVELAFSNPLRNRFPEWRGCELPFAVTTNNMAFTLNGVQQTSNALWRLSFVVRTNETVDPSWRVGGITASSASGNVFSTRSNLATAAQTLNFHLRAALWPEEPVWRFEVEFYRAADFHPGELWTLTNVVIPSRNLAFRFATNLTSHGNQPIELKLESIPPVVPFPRAIARNANAYVQFENDAHVFVVAATDDQAREVKTEVHLGIPRSSYFFGLAIPPGARSLNLTLAIRRPTTVTFDVATRSLIYLDRK